MLVGEVPKWQLWVKDGLEMGVTVQSWIGQAGCPLGVLNLISPSFSPSLQLIFVFFTPLFFSFKLILPALFCIFSHLRVLFQAAHV